MNSCPYFRIPKLFIARSSKQRTLRAVYTLNVSLHHEPSPIAVDHKHTFKHWQKAHLTSGEVEEPALLVRQILVLLDGCIMHLRIHCDPTYAVARLEPQNV